MILYFMTRRLAYSNFRHRGARFRLRVKRLAFIRLEADGSKLSSRISITPKS